MLCAVVVYILITTFVDTSSYLPYYNKVDIDSIDYDNGTYDWLSIQDIPSSVATIGVREDNKLDRYDVITNDIYKYGKQSSVLFVGDSITELWYYSNHYAQNNTDGKAIFIDNNWNQLPYNVINLGVYGDLTQHVIYRLEHEHGDLSLYNIPILKL